MNRIQGGRRSSLQLDLMYYSSKNNKIYQIGEWKRGDGLHVHDKNGKPSTTEDQTWDKHDNKLDRIFQNDSIDPVTLVVVTKAERPYVIYNKSKIGNEAYDGFAIDLLKVGQYADHCTYYVLILVYLYDYIHIL